jgi:hypothetical protein
MPISMRIKRNLKFKTEPLTGIYSSINSVDKVLMRDSLMMKKNEIILKNPVLVSKPFDETINIPNY